ncbi:uncharacterized protein A4U43_C06F11640 [Asparagus officinalis]|uniref:Uncharacterized protein n=1 Tax=Asparagus officinalis TaxID=4686 RepID=A0A5P1EL79_ASPOF|nr:uncharacterized protein A4U43_C06F11640 [Asparagus officinalis]
MEAVPSVHGVPNCNAKPNLSPTQQIPIYNELKQRPTTICNELNQRPNLKPKRNTTHIKAKYPAPLQNPRTSFPLPVAAAAAAEASKRIEEMPPKFDPSQVVDVYVMVTGGEVVTVSSLALKIGPFFLKNRRFLIQEGCQEDEESFSR